MSITDARTLAESIYTASSDLDFADYADTYESDVAGLEMALKALGNNNILYKALERIYN